MLSVPSDLHYALIEFIAHVNAEVNHLYLYYTHTNISIHVHIYIYIERALHFGLGDDAACAQRFAICSD